MQPYPNLDTAKVLLTLCLGCFAPAIADAEIDRSTTLEAIHLLENPRNLTRPGPCGELGAYQFRATTWRAYTAEPFGRALERSMSDYVAARHFEWLKARLEAAHLPVSTYNIALAWNGGLRAVVTGRAPRVAKDYAQRAANLAGVVGRAAVVAEAK